MLLDTLKNEIKKLENVIVELESKNYKPNRKTIELKGDGPAKHETMSIGAINENKKRKKIEQIENRIFEIKKTIKRVENDYPMFVENVKNALNKYEFFGQGFKDSTPSIEDMKDMAVSKLVLNDPYQHHGSDSIARMIWTEVENIPEPKDDISDIFKSFMATL